MSIAFLLHRIDPVLRPVDMRPIAQFLPELNMVGDRGVGLALKAMPSSTCSAVTSGGQDRNGERHQNEKPTGQQRRTKFFFHLLALL